MRISDITTNPLFISTGTKQSISTVFTGNTLNKTGVATPFKECLEKYANSKNDDWCISNYYQVPVNEVWPKIREVQQAIELADFLGMTDIEIYDWIENKYAEAFGKDFMMAYNLGGVADPVKDLSTPEPGYNYVHIGSSFYGSVIKQFGSSTTRPSARCVEINRERLFGNMSNREIMDTVRAKYPPNSSLTYGDYRRILSELESVGIRVGGCYDLGHYAKLDSNGKVISSYENELGRIVARIVNEPLDFSRLFENLNNYIKLGRNEPFEAEYRDFYVKYFGAVVGPGGLVYPNQIEFNMQNIMFSKPPTAEDELMRILDKHIERQSDTKSKKLPDNQRHNNKLKIVSGHGAPKTLAIARDELPKQSKNAYGIERLDVPFNQNQQTHIYRLDISRQ